MTMAAASPLALSPDSAVARASRHAVGRAERSETDIFLGYSGLLVQHLSLRPMKDLKITTRIVYVPILYQYTP